MIARPFWPYVTAHLANNHDKIAIWRYPVVFSQEIIAGYAPVAKNDLEFPADMVKCVAIRFFIRIRRYCWCHHAAGVSGPG